MRCTTRNPVDRMSANVRSPRASHSPNRPTSLLRQFDAEPLIFGNTEDLVVVGILEAGCAKWEESLAERGWMLRKSGASALRCIDLLGGMEGYPMFMLR